MTKGSVTHSSPIRKIIASRSRPAEEFSIGEGSTVGTFIAALLLPSILLAFAISFTSNMSMIGKAK